MAQRNCNTMEVSQGALQTDELEMTVARRVFLVVWDYYNSFYIICK